jgi:hypothetical protein
VNLIGSIPDTWRASFYRTSAGAEIDLVLEGPRRRTIAIEIKRTLTPQLDKGFRLGCDDVAATERFCAIPAGRRHPLGADTEAIALTDLLAWLGEVWGPYRAPGR